MECFIKAAFSTLCASVREAGHSELLMFLSATHASQLGAHPASLSPLIHRCSVCPYTTDTVSDLIEHEQTHMGEHHLTCRFCAQVAASSQELKQHEQTHVDKQRFKCRTCHYTAASECCATRSKTSRRESRRYSWSPKQRLTRVNCFLTTCGKAQAYWRRASAQRRGGSSADSALMPEVS
ncbi:zinc finger protein 513-like [Ornithodoros turicata]|uniref:zinc finger protein 513-like n=1 Tax=Ornithodoros turicata TaxID=34597 RepID=UPI00313A45AE